MPTKKNSVCKVVLVVVIVGVFLAAAVAGEDWQEQIDTWEGQGADINSRGHRIPRNLDAIAVSIGYTW